jgi:hypothetical protein
MASTRRRLDYLGEGAHLSLTALWQDSWYRHVTLAGHVASLERDPELVDIDRLSRHYTGNPYRARDQERWSAWIDVDRWHGWDAGQPWPPKDQR